jgi:hypothetical protein
MRARLGYKPVTRYSKEPGRLACYSCCHRGYQIFCRRGMLRIFVAMPCESNQICQRLSVSAGVRVCPASRRGCKSRAGAGTDRQPAWLLRCFRPRQPKEPIRRTSASSPRRAPDRAGDDAGGEFTGTSLPEPPPGFRSGVSGQFGELGLCRPRVRLPGSFQRLSQGDSERAEPRQQGLTARSPGPAILKSAQECRRRQRVLVGRATNPDRPVVADPLGECRLCA